MVPHDQATTMRRIGRESYGGRARRGVVRSPESLSGASSRFWRKKVRTGILAPGILAFDSAEYDTTPLKYD